MVKNTVASGNNTKVEDNKKIIMFSSFAKGC